MAVVARRFLIGGRVQGVGFRMFAADRAAHEGVTGYARNLPDGRVEAAFEGTQDDVADLVRWAGQGPPHAAVTGVEVHEEQPEGATRFEVR